MTAARLARQLDGAMLGGVANGLAGRYDFDVTVVRVAAVLLAFATGGLVVVAYLLLWLLLPAAPAEPATPSEDTPTDQASRDAEPAIRRDLDEVVDATRVVADNLARAAREATEAAQAAAKELAALASRAARTTTATIDPEPATEATADEDVEDAPTAEEGATDESERGGEESEETVEPSAADPPPSSSTESYAWGDGEQGDASEEAEGEGGSEGKPPDADDEVDVGTDDEDARE